MPTECAESGCVNQTDSGICQQCAAEQKYGTTSRAYDADGSRVELREGETRDDDSHTGVVAAQLAEADDETREELEDEREVRTDGGTVEDWHGTEAPASVDGVDLLEADACPACESTGTFFEGPAGYFTCDRCHSTWAGDAGDAEIVTYLEWTENKKLVTDGGEPDADVSEQSATQEEIEAWDEENDEPHPVFDVPHRPERQKVVIDRPDYADGQSLSVYNVATWGRTYWNACQA